MRLTALAWPRGLTPTRLAALTSALLVVAIAWTLAEAVWTFWPGGDGRAGEPTRAPLAVQARAEPAYRLQGVADLSLLGTAPVAAAAGQEAPQTQLNLILRGVWANSTRGKGRAIIAGGDGSENAYKVGDALPGGAVLDQVLPDRVILKRGGRLEALFLPKESLGAGVASAGEMAPGIRNEFRPVPGAGQPAGDLGVRLQEYRQRILNDPQEAFSLARMQPVMEDGKLKGYKLSPNKEKVLFREIGLRPGDVVTSVNGLSLGDPAAAGQVMTQISSASQLTLTVDRGGRQETIVVPIGQ